MDRKFVIREVEGIFEMHPSGLDKDTNSKIQKLTFEIIEESENILEELDKEPFSVRFAQTYSLTVIALLINWQLSRAFVKRNAPVSPTYSEKQLMELNLEQVNMACGRQIGALHGPENYGYIASMRESAAKILKGFIQRNGNPLATLRNENSN